MTERHDTRQHFDRTIDTAMATDEKNTPSIEQILELERAQREDLKIVDQHIVQMDRRLLGANIVGFVLFALLSGLAAYLWVSAATKHCERRQKADAKRIKRMRLVLEQWKKDKAKKQKAEAERATLLAKLMGLYHKGEDEKALNLLPKADAAATTPLERTILNQITIGLNRRAALRSLARGISEYQKDKTKEATKHLLQVLKYCPTGPIALQAHYYAGLCYHKRQDYRKAALHLGAVATAPGGEDILDDTGLFRLGHSHDLLKQSQAAKKYYSLLLEKYPKSPFAPVAKTKLRQLGGP